MPDNDGRGIALLDLRADHRVLRRDAGRREVPVRRQDPGPREHSLPRHASELALQGRGEPRLLLPPGREPDVAAFRGVHLVAIAPPREESHTQTGPGADEPDGGARLRLAGLQRLHVLGAQERDTVTDRREIVDEDTRRDADLLGEGARVYSPREVRRQTGVLRRRARHPDTGALRPRTDLRGEGPHDRREPGVRAAGIGALFPHDRAAIRDLHERQARVRSAHVAGEDVHGTGRGSCAAARGSRNHTPSRARTAGTSLGEGASPSSARATAGALSRPVTSTTTCRAAAMTGGVIVIRWRGGFGLSTSITRRRRSRTAGAPGNRDAVCPSEPMPRTSTSSAAGSSRP